MSGSGDPTGTRHIFIWPHHTGTANVVTDSGYQDTDLAFFTTFDISK